MGILGHGRESVGIAVKATDVLFVLAWSNVAFTLRGIANLRPKDGGEAVPLTVDAVVTNDRLTSSGKLVIMQDGVIDSAAFAGLGSGPTQRGQCFAQFFITRGGASSIYGVLMAGYVYTGSQLGFGFIEQPGPAGGPGAIANLNAAQPAVGVNPVSQSVPTGAIQRILSVAGQLVTGAAAANRRADVLMSRGGATVHNYAGGAQPASVTTNYEFAKGAAYSDVSDFALTTTPDWTESPLADIFLLAGDTYQLTAINIQAADQWTGVTAISSEEWVMPN